MKGSQPDKKGPKSIPDHQIAPVVKKVRLGHEGTDFAYWQQQTPQARLAALEEIRQEYHRWKYRAEPDVQRVYSIIKR